MTTPVLLTRALDVACPACHAKAGRPCAQVGARFCRARVAVAVARTRAANLAGRAVAK